MSFSKLNTYVILFNFKLYLNFYSITVCLLVDSTWSACNINYNVMEWKWNNYSL